MPPFTKECGLMPLLPKNVVYASFTARMWFMPHLPQECGQCRIPDLKVAQCRIPDLKVEQCRITALKCGYCRITALKCGYCRITALLGGGAALPLF